MSNKLKNTVVILVVVLMVLTGIKYASTSLSNEIYSTFTAPAIMDSPVHLTK